jgi:hypothetical protein
MDAFLWTPQDLIELDLHPWLTRERQRGHGQLGRRVWSAAFRLPRRAVQVVELLEALIGEASELPPYDGSAARAWIATLEARSAKLRGRWPAWVYCRTAEYAAHRLLPQRVAARVERPLPCSIAARVAHLESSGRLVLAPPRRLPTYTPSSMSRGPTWRGGRTSDETSCG